MNLKFTKMHGIGNDFMVVDGVRQKVFFSPELIKRLADRHFGVGFDQLLLVEPPYDPDLDFHYRIFNADGSEVQMCGNGARCFASFVLSHNLIAKRQIKVSTISGVLTLTVNDNDSVTVNMGKPIFEPEKIPFIADTVNNSYELALPDGRILQVGSVSMGNPHVVVKVDELSDELVSTLGPILECHERFPQKVNVGFMQVISNNEINLRVYERGCGETLACGSGACAACVVGINQGLLNNKVKVNLKGGSLLVEYKGGSSNVMMTGPAVCVYEGSIEV